jgi:hypothetical protein
VSRGGLVALPGGLPDRPASWEQLLHTAVRPEFYLTEPGDPALFGPTCLVAGCDARGMQRPCCTPRTMRISRTPSSTWAVPSATKPCLR